MRDVLVAIDLETTGLNPSYDRIIEIGAVKFQGDEVLGEYQTLVDPGIPISDFITQLTGISDEVVAGAPGIRDVMPDLRSFIGRATLVGHNVNFDLGFLRAAGLRTPNAAVDTYVLASVMLPSTPRYNLRSLSAMLGLETPSTAIDNPTNSMDLLRTHAALGDAHRHRLLYLELWQRILALPLDVLAEIVRLGKHVEWDGALAFEAAMQARSREVFSGPQRRSGGDSAELGEWFGEPRDHLPELRPRLEPRPVDSGEIGGHIRPGGALSQAFDGYEFRAQQLDMLEHVTRAFNDGRHVLIEAPTGVGKSLAYLLPAATFAARNDARVVISTNTINLQEQLLNKDIPMLQQALNLPVRAAALKGKRNYLCPRRLAALRRRGPTSPEEMHILAKVLVWLTQNQSGDRSEITLRGAVEAALWSRLSAEDEGCTMERCLSQMGGTCPFFKARREAESAHLLIVNHALLLSDIATEGRVLPPFEHLIVDEAHHLEDAVTSSMTFRTDPESIKRQVGDLGTEKTGLMGDLLVQTRDVIPDGFHRTLTEFVHSVLDASRTMNVHVDRLFATLQQFLKDHTSVSHSEYTAQIRILDELRRQPAWTEVEMAWDNLSQFTGTIAEAIVQLARGLNDLIEYDIENFDDLVAGMASAARHLTELHERLNEIVSQPDGNMIYWAEFQPEGGSVSVHAAPLEVGPLVEKYLWHQKRTIVMTSATLRTDATFDFIRGRLGAADAEEAVVESPFDYEDNTLLYIVNDIPEPGDRDRYQAAIERGLIDLCRATEGRTLVLFTSYAQLRQTANAISDELARDGITVFDQSDGSSRSQLLEGFVSTDKAVLLGTRSFWEGVDVPGANLSVLVIVRLPFSVPSDPLFAARSEQFDSPFDQYALPETILRFRQGFGRLIRRKDDRGVVAIFDRRVISKRYGQLFLNSLPACTVYRGRMADLPRLAVEWLGKPTDEDIPF